MKPLPILQFLLFFLTSILLYSCQTDKAKSTPNIVFILADDLGWADVGFRDNPLHETPNLDQLAREGMTLNRFYPSAANCAPSRAGILTGMYGPRHHVYLPQGYAREGNVEKMRWKVPSFGEDSTYQTFPVNINHVDPGITSLAELLEEAGYITARLGKWHIGDDNQGFTYNSSAGVLGEYSNRNGKEERYYNDTTVARKLTDTALELMEKHKEDPFFIYLSHWEVHTPMAARQDRVDYYRQKISSLGLEGFDPVYAAEVEQLDKSVGRVMEKLRQLELEDNTLLVFTSDNGGLMRFTDNGPLRAGKGTFYEGGIRVPAVFRWPAVILAGRSSEYPVSGVDFMPTFADLAGLSPPGGQPVDGLSLLPLMKGEELPDRSIFFHFPLYLEGQDKERVLPVYGTEVNHWRAVPSSVVINGDWKLIKYHEYDGYELFDLGSDISEDNDLKTTEKVKARALLDTLQQWLDNTGAPIPNVPNEKFHAITPK
ncbi:sulfatase [Pleomorphovibrio marinus]|uniref:sulfatase n=1 Tax=Pleomorphovibrio marinus TaxID=2164132 RepID=UPI000E0B52A2|nr:sulfatase [Pleomorphovibrio marinus]